MAMAWFSTSRETWKACKVRVHQYHAQRHKEMDFSWCRCSQEAECNKQGIPCQGLVRYRYLSPVTTENDCLFD